MRREYIKHEHLRRILNDMASGEDALNEENFEALFKELRHSYLIMAGDMDDDGIYLFRSASDDTCFALLFTDMDEFRKVFPKRDVAASDHVFEKYKTMFTKLDMDGFIINLASEGFIFRKEMFNLVEDLPLYKLPSDEPYTSQELKTIKDSINNESMEAFIENPKNVGKYEELFEEMSRSTMLTMMLSREDLTDIAEDGIIKTLENGPVAFMHIEEMGGTYATMYTSEAKMAEVNTTLNKYSQIVNPALMAFFILSDDMDGLIINPNSDNVLLTRDVLLEYSNVIQETCNNPRLNKAIFEMFIIEEEA